MRLLKLSVRAFQCIEHAEVEFGPGLNVLYGPNDHGKSSLASAIRAVLLLQHGSAAYEQFVSWHSTHPPSVSLTLSTDPQRYWRVRKSFGRGSAGSSSLEFSKDGHSFSPEASGRQVDEKLRELLAWGVPAPGGKGGAGAGVPRSFLSNVLLAEQEDVAAVLGRGLTPDLHESGRARIGAALQALAQDPLFKRVLDASVVKVDEAFTPTGQRSRAKGSPFQRIAQQIRELRGERDALQAKLGETLGRSRSCSSSTPS